MASDPTTVAAMNVNLPDSDHENGDQAVQQPQEATAPAAPLLTAVESFAQADTLIAEAVARSQALLHGKATTQSSPIVKPMTPDASTDVLDEELAALELLESVRRDPEERGASVRLGESAQKSRRRPVRLRLRDDHRSQVGLAGALQDRGHAFCCRIDGTGKRSPERRSLYLSCTGSCMLSQLKLRTMLCKRSSRWQAAQPKMCTLRCKSPL